MPPTISVASGERPSHAIGSDRSNGSAATTNAFARATQGSKLVKLHCNCLVRPNEYSGQTTRASVAIRAKAAPLGPSTAMQIIVSATWTSNPANSQPSCTPCLPSPLKIVPQHGNPINMSARYHRNVEPLSANRFVNTNTMIGSANKLQKQNM